MNWLRRVDRSGTTRWSVMPREENDWIKASILGISSTTFRREKYFASLSISASSSKVAIEEKACTNLSISVESIQTIISEMANMDGKAHTSI